MADVENPFSWEEIFGKNQDYKYFSIRHAGGTPNDALKIETGNNVAPNEEEAVINNVDIDANTGSNRSPKEGTTQKPNNTSKD